MEYEDYVKGLEKIKRIAASGAEYWMARDLSRLFGYDEWRNFKAVIEKAVNASKGSHIEHRHHFVETTKMIELGKGASRPTEDWFLTRYACYLIAMNADSSKALVAFAQSYFAVQTRRQELDDQQRRLKSRLRVIDATKNVNSTASRSGLENQFASFHDAGYRGMYGGRGLSEIKHYKGLDQAEDLFDRCGAAELAANEYRLTQTDMKIRREQIKGKESLINAHRAVGQKVRSNMEEIGGVMPEDLKPEPSIKALVAKHRRQVREGQQKKAAS